MNIQKAIENLKRHGFDVTFFDSKDEACHYIKNEIKNTAVGIGGSMTALELGLYDLLKENNTVWSHTVQKDREAAINGASQADIYMTSANGISESGEIINIDGAGNRVSAMLYNKKVVYIIVGINKFADTFEDALWRARNIASPKNARRFNLKTPCAVNADKCYDCSSPDRICNGLVVLWRRMFGVRKMEVVIINENLGF